MAAITISSSGGFGARTQTNTASTGSDTFTYQPGDILFWLQSSGGTAGLTLTGSGAGIIGIPGGGQINAALGVVTQTKPNGAACFLYLDDIAQYLVGTVTVTGSAVSCFYSIIRRS